MDITKFKETLLEFLGDVTAIPDHNKQSFVEGKTDNMLFDAPDGYMVLSPFLLVKVQESTRMREMPTTTDSDIVTEIREENIFVPPEPETYVCQITIRLYTENYKYTISANWKEYTPQYLGCVVDGRKNRVGENWSRGNDMHDGHFCRETWNKIKNEIISREMKGVAKYIVNGRYTREN